METSGWLTVNQMPRGSKPESTVASEPTYTRNDPRANGCASENCRVVEVDLMHRDCGMGFSVALANDNLRSNQIRRSTIKNIDGTEAKR
jgi:hypothetical protein